MLGRDMNIPVLAQKDKMFPDMNSFYFLEPTQKQGEFELYFTNQREDSRVKNLIVLIATFYQYDTAKIVMNTLNKNLRKLNN